MKLDFKLKLVLQNGQSYLGTRSCDLRGNIASYCH